jgi:hypothetical protein
MRCTNGPQDPTVGTAKTRDARRIGGFAHLCATRVQARHRLDQGGLNASSHLVLLLARQLLRVDDASMAADCFAVATAKRYHLGVHDVCVHMLLRAFRDRIDAVRERLDKILDPDGRAGVRCRDDQADSSGNSIAPARAIQWTVHSNYLWTWALCLLISALVTTVRVGMIPRSSPRCFLSVEVAVKKKAPQSESKSYCFGLCFGLCCSSCTNRS